MSTNMFVIHASSSCVGQVLGSSGHGQGMTEIATETKRVCLFGAGREKVRVCYFARKTEENEVESGVRIQTCMEASRSMLAMAGEAHGTTLPTILPWVDRLRHGRPATVS